MKDLFEKRGKLEVEMKRLIDTAEAENRDLSAEENQTWDKLIKEDNELRSRIERHQRLNETRSELDRIVPDGDPRPASRVGEFRDQDQVTDETRSLAFQAWALQGSKSKITTRHIEAVRKTGFIVDDREPEFNLARTSEIRTLQDLYRTTHPSVLITRSLNVASDNEIIPQGFVNAFEKKLLAVGGMLQVVETIRTDSGNDLPYPTVDDTANDAAILAEETDYGASVDPTISAVTLKAYKFSSKPVLVSRELVEDSAFDLAVLLGELLGERIGRRLNNRLTVGTGTAEPNGIITAATVGKTTASATAIAADELIDLYHSVDPAYRGSASVRFMMHDSIVAAIRKLKDSDGVYLWQSGLRDGAPDRLLGVPVTLNQAMASSVATGNKTVAFGDMSKYKLRVVRGLRLRHLLELYAATDQEAFIGFLRADGNLLNTSAVKVLQQL